MGIDNNNNIIPKGGTLSITDNFFIITDNLLIIFFSYH